MSFLYPRTITLWRLPAENAAGAQGYIGETSTNLAQITGSCAAAIQAKKDSGSQPAHLAGDISKRVYWEILTAPGTQVFTRIQSNDEIQDDLNYKYQVVSAYLTSFGNWQLLCERKEA